MTRAIGEPGLEGWEQLTSAGFCALSRQDWRKAAEAWQQAVGEVQSTEPWDARLAAAANNAGVTSLIASNWADARVQFDKARELWAQVRAHIPELDIPVLGRSSVFHFRLASRHQDAFSAHRRNRCVAFCTAASAITDFNATLAQHASTNGSSASINVDAIANAVIEAFGPRCPEAKLLRAYDGDAEIDARYKEKAERALVLQARSMIAALSNDYRRLEMATNLTALLSPGLVGVMRQSIEINSTDQSDNERI